MEDIVDYEVEMDLGDMGHGQGIVDSVNIEIDKKEQIVRVSIGLY